MVTFTIYVNHLQKMYSCFKLPHLAYVTKISDQCCLQ